jgi:hypothetical protein
LGRVPRRAQESDNHHTPSRGLHDAPASRENRRAKTTATKEDAAADQRQAVATGARGQHRRQFCSVVVLLTATVIRWVIGGKQAQSAPDGAGVLVKEGCYVSENPLCDKSLQQKWGRTYAARPAIRLGFERKSALVARVGP